MFYYMSIYYAPIIVLPEGGNPGRTSGNPGECQIYMEQSLTFSRDLGKGGKLNSPGPWGMDYMLHTFYGLYVTYFVLGHVYTLVGLI